MTTIKLTGLPLSDLGLENAVVRFGSGTIVPFEGFAIQNGETIVEAIQKSLPPDASLFLRHEDAQVACAEAGHNWIEHYSWGVPTFRVCLDCSAREQLQPEPEPPVREDPEIVALRLRVGRSYRRRELLRGVGTVLGLLALAGMLVALAGCVTACPPGQCIGPYDLTLSSHREALGID